MPKEYTPQEILTLSLGKNDANARTVGEYLARLTTKLLFKQEAFDAEEPFGNPGWIDDLIYPLILNGYIDGELDDSGNVKEYDETGFKTLINRVTLFLQIADYSTLTLPPEPKEHYVMEFYKNGEIAGYDSTPYTKEEAEKELEDYDPDDDYSTWRVVHIPPVT